jgi:polyhydroxyalkanoate synthesis regulator phasin
MNSDNLVQLIQKSFRITLGATTSIIEVLQNPDKRQANFSEMRSKLNERMEDWETKGEVTEQEARRFVDVMWQQRQNGNSRSYNPADSSPVSPDNNSTVDPQVQTELERLTAQISAMRTELELLRQTENK